MHVTLKYGKKEITVKVPDDKIAGVYHPRDLPGMGDLEQEVLRAVQNPIAAARLGKLVSPEKSVAILVEDSTRPVPTNRVLRVLMPQLQDAGAELGKISVICATGVHRGLSRDEFRKILGEYYGAIHAINHEPDNEAQLEVLGATSAGNEVKINKTFHQADVKLIICDTEFHQFCGYGGGAKSVLPGIADRKSVERCHARMDAKGAEPGRIEGNPVREEIEEAGRMAKVDFIINVVLNRNREAVAVFAGHLFEAFVAATKVYDSMYKVRVRRRADTAIVSAGGHPRDINLYQAQKAIETGVKVVEKGGRIIVLAECPEGHGSELFHKWMVEEPDLDVIIRKIRDNFILGAHKAYQIARELKWAKVYLYSAMPMVFVMFT